MRTTLVLVVLLVCSCVAFHSTRIRKAEKLFDEWLETHPRQYKNSAERQWRLSVFADNLDRIAELNAQEPHATFGLNEFSDITPEEFQQTYLIPMHFENMYALLFFFKMTFLANNLQKCQLLPKLLLLSTLFLHAAVSLLLLIGAILMKLL